MDAFAVLRSARLFSSVPEPELQVLAAVSFTRRLGRGQVLFSEGEPSDYLYVVASGRLKVQIAVPSGEALLLTVVGVGDCLGELSVVDGEARSTSAVALVDVGVLAVPCEVLRERLRQSPALALSWAQVLCAMVRRLTSSTGDLVLLDLPRRLAKLLLEESGTVVDLGLSQTEVAARLGAARQSLNRALSGLQARGWVRVDGTRVQVLDRAALHRFVSL